MWYSPVFEELIVSKIRKNEQTDALCFIRLFFSDCHNILEEPIPPLALFGLMDKLYKKYGHLNNGSVALAPFARDFIGLAIVLMKAAFDRRIWNINFNLAHPKILSALGFDPYLDSDSLPSDNFLQKKLPSDGDDWDDGDNDCEFPADINHIASFESQLNFLEVVAFRDWKYDLSVDFDHVLSLLLIHRNTVIPALFEYLKAFTGKSNLFDEFICKLWLMLLAHHYISQKKLERFSALMQANTEEIADVLRCLAFAKNMTPLILSEIIQNYLNSKQNKKALLEHLHQLIDTRTESYLKSHTEAPAKEALNLTFTQLRQLITNRDELMKAPLNEVVGFFTWNTMHSQLIQRIHAQFSMEARTQIKWHKITLRELVSLCNTHNIQILSELDASLFDISAIDAHNQLTDLQTSLLEGFGYKTSIQWSSLAKIGMFSPAHIPLPDDEAQDVLPHCL